MRLLVKRTTGWQVEAVGEPLVSVMEGFYKANGYETTVIE